jgi:serine/threonine protein kinase
MASRELGNEDGARDPMERIGEYEIRRMVGEGGMGKVYEAEERLSRRRVALKVLRPELARSEEGRRLFLNEMQILAHLEHPNVVRSLATCEVDGQLVMALEFLEGRTLREELVDKGRLPWPEAARIVVAIGEGLAAAHAHDPPVVHRDLKPENVMLVATGQGSAHVKVMDFGVAKVLAAAQATNTQSVGTLQYMSPEQIDARTIDARSDLYALGLVLYECLAGAPPFRSASARELLNMQCATPAPDLPEEVRATLPAGIEAILFAMLEKAPDARPADAGAVLSKLAPFVSAGARSSRATSSSVPAQSPQTPNAPSAKARSDTLVSTPAPAVARRDDTVDLVERATQPRQISTLVALALILVLSVLAGLTAYVLRLRLGTGTQASAEPVPAKAVSAPRP